jgi:predicted amidophosphoribosyltransferase
MMPPDCLLFMVLLLVVVWLAAAGLKRRGPVCPRCRKLLPFFDSACERRRRAASGPCCLLSLVPLSAWLPDTQLQL